jgi:hypothetical protein
VTTLQSKLRLLLSLRSPTTLPPFLYSKGVTRVCRLAAPWEKGAERHAAASAMRGERGVTRLIPYLASSIERAIQEGTVEGRKK